MRKKLFKQTAQQEREEIAELERRIEVRKIFGLILYLFTW